MESRVMSPKLHIKIFGININAEGAIAIGATVVLVLAILAFNRF
jgi:hypothetical protein